MVRQQQGIQSLWIKSFGGVCQSPVGKNVPPGLLSSATDMELTHSGELVPRRGRRRLYDTSAPDGNPVEVAYPLNFDGEHRLLVSTKENVYEVNFSGGWIHVKTLVPSPHRTLFALFNKETVPFVVFGNGKTPLQVWNGSTSRDAIGAPVGRPMNYLNYVVVFNIDGSPGLVQISINANDPDEWLSGGFISGIESRGSVVSCFAYVGLIVFTEDGSRLFSGDPSIPSSASIQELSPSIGAASHESVADVGGVLMWASFSGIKAWVGGGQFPTADISNPDPGEAAGPTFPRYGPSNIGQDVLEISWTNTRKISAAYWSHRRAYVFSALTNGGYQKTWIFDTTKKAWFPWTLECLCLADAINFSNANRLLCGGTGGVLYEVGANNYIDDNASGEDPTVYNWEFAFPDMDFALPNNTKEFRAVVVGSRAVGMREFSISGVLDFNENAQPAEYVDFILGVSLLGDRLTGELFSTDGTVSITPGGFSLGDSRLGGTIGLGSSYTEAREPIASRGRYFRLRVMARPSTIEVAAAVDAEYPGGCFKLFRSDGSLLVDTPFGTRLEALNAVGNQFAVPISSICIEWRPVGARRQSIMNILPEVTIAGPFVADVEVSAATVGVEAEFRNVSGNTSYASAWKWYVDGVLVGEDDAGLDYTFTDSGPHDLTLKATVDVGPPVEKTIVVQVSP